MVKWLNIGFSVALIIMIGVLYHIRYSAEGEARALKKMERAIAAEEDVQRTLRAEWSSLNDPRRLQDLARHYLKLDYLRPSQVMDMRPDTTRTIAITLQQEEAADEPR